MFPVKETPCFDDALDGDSKAGGDDATGLPTRLDRYSKAHHRALQMADYARERGEVKTAGKLHQCGNYLLFRDYFTVGKIRLAASNSCYKHLLCPLCAIRRGAKQVKAYLDRLQVILASQPDLRLSLVTLTVKDGDDLAERFRHLTQSFRRMQQARRSYLRGKGPHVELSKFEGAVGSYEFKRGKNSGQWHPHVHMVVLHRADIDAHKLSSEWHKFTGDSYIVDVTPFHDDKPPVDGFLEVFKYALKFSDMPLEDNWHGFETLSGKRLVFSFGEFWGVQVPEDLDDDLLDDLPYVDLLFQFARGVGYNFKKSLDANGKMSVQYSHLEQSWSAGNEQIHDGTGEAGFSDGILDQVRNPPAADGPAGLVGPVKRRVERRRSG